MRNHRGLIIIIGIMTIFLSACSEMKIIEEKQKTKIETEIVQIKKTMKKIEIDSQIADIIIKTEDREDIRIDLNTYEEGPMLNVENENELKITANQKENGIMINIGIQETPTLTIILPKFYSNDLKVVASTADLNANDLELENFELDSSTGDVNIKDIKAKKVEITSSTGDIEIDRIESDLLQIDTTTGDVELKNTKCNIIGKTSVGDITIEYNLYDYDLEYESSTGDIELILNNENASYTINAESNIGEIVAKIFLSEVIEKNDKVLKGTVGSGINKIKVKSSVGDIIIKK